MRLGDRLLHFEGSAWTDALNEATADDLLAALNRPDLVTRRRVRILDALQIKFGIVPDSKDVAGEGPQPAAECSGEAVASA